MFDPKLNEIKAESTVKVEKAEAFARALRFISPSFYLKGK